MKTYVTRYGDTLVGIALAQGLCNAVGTSSCIKAADRIAYANRPSFDDWTVDDYVNQSLNAGITLAIPEGAPSTGTVNADELTILGAKQKVAVLGLLLGVFVFYLMNKP